MGRDGKPHPAIGLGLWAVGRWTAADESRTRETIVHALARGLRWFDTAEVYGTGRSERVLGDVLASGGAPAEGLFLGTKVSWEHLRPTQVRAALTGSLQRLGRRSVDLYLVHAPDPHVPIAQTMGALETLWKEGKIGAIGVSNFGIEELERAQSALAEAEIVVAQVRYNLFDREDADPIREYCAKRKIVLEAYTPLLRGLLVGRYLDGTRPPPEVQRFTHRLLEDEALSEILLRARRLRDLAKEVGLPMASLALHWLRDRGAAPVFGASRPDQVDAVLEAFASAPERSVLERADRIALGETDA
ncbi:MAG: aldo/keto reductase [Thermoplasmata archaeon]|nr:aldo/keto reductase [Thermoplasmata archaeon]MCI4359761.1 aldo/keto reductase [Thermoplasmata archaeon]